MNFDVTPDYICKLYKGYRYAMIDSLDGSTDLDFDRAFDLIQEETKDIKPYTEYLEKKSDYPDRFPDWKFGDSSEYFLEGDGKQLPPAVHCFIQEHEQLWSQDLTWVQNEVFRNTFGKEYTITQLQIAKVFLLMIYRQVTSNMFSHEIVSVEQIPISKEARKERSIKWDEWHKEHERKLHLDKDFLDGKINEHGEHYNEGDK